MVSSAPDGFLFNPVNVLLRLAIEAEPNDETRAIMVKALAGESLEED